MANGRIDDIIDYTKIKEQFQKVFDLMDELARRIAALNAAGAGINLNGRGGGRGAGNNNATAQATQQLTALERAIERLNHAESVLGQNIAIVNEATRQQSLENRQNARQTLAASGSLNDLRARLAAATTSFDNMTRAQRRNRAEGGEAVRNIQQLQREIRELEQQTGRFQRNVGNYPRQLVGGITGFLGAFGIATGVAAIGKISKDMFDANVGASDQLADLQRIMGVTAKDVDTLYNSLKQLDTRTSTSGLLNIATVAAKAGVEKENITGVTEAIDKLVVVLGSELGNADQVTESLVKITNIFSKDGKVTGETLTAIGNGILELANAGVATAPFIVDYTQRLAGLAKTANFSLGAALGLGAGFEELGQSAEVAGTATVQILGKIAADVPKFAKIAGKSVAEFTKTLRESPAEALIQVSQAITKNKKGFDQISEAFKDVEAKGVRVSSVFATMGSNADFFRGKIDLANRSLEDANNINSQFAIKNETLAASYEKLKKAISDLITGSGMSEFFKTMVDGATQATKAIGGLYNAINNTLRGVTDNPSTDELFKLAKDSGSGSNPWEKSRLSAFNDQYQKAVVIAKKANDAYMESIKNDSVKTKMFLLETANADYIAQKAIYDKLKNENKGTSKESIKASLLLIQLADKRKRIQESILSTSPGRQKVDTSVSAGNTEATEAELKKSSRLKELQLKADFELRKLDLQSAIDTQKEIVDNEKNSLNERLAALDYYNALKETLLKESSAAEKKMLEENIKQGQAVGEQGKVIEAKAAQERIKNIQESGKLMQSILKDNADKELKTITDANALATTKLESDSLAELEQARKLYDNGTISLEQFEALKLQIQNKYNILALQQEAEYTNQVIALRKSRGEDTTEAELSLLSINNKINKLGLDFFAKNEKDKTDAAKKGIKEREDAEKEYNARVKDLRKELANAVFSILTAQFENEKNKIQDQIDLINNRKDSEIKAISESTASEQEKADRIAVINAKSQAEEERLNQRKRQVAQQEARFERAKSVASIVANTAAAIMKTFSTFAYPLALPIALVIGATGAAQLATVLAQPIPRYKDGRMDGPAEWAYVGDGGRHEVVETERGAYMTPATPTLTYLGKGDKVHKTIDDYVNSIGGMAFGRVPAMEVNANGALQMKAELANQTGQIVSAIQRNKSVMVVKNTWAGVMVSEQRASGLNYYLGKNVVS